MSRHGVFGRMSSIRLSPPLDDRIRALARARGQRPSEVIRDLLWRGLDATPAPALNDPRPELAASGGRRN